jgi:predicted membrane channel-forming protein YqfA (hemolysin III family)
MSHAAFVTWMHRDYFGIAVAILGCYVPGIYYAFECMPDLRAPYYTVVAGLLAACVRMQQQDTASNGRRALVFACVVGFGLVPCMHWAWRLGDLDPVSPRDPALAAAERALFIPRVLGAYALAGAGVAFYLSRFPECCCAPGRVDVLGASHQWWHVLIAAGLGWWYCAGLALLEFRLEHPCT